MSREVRVRFAPSPTGLLHIGGVRTALYNYFVAKKHNGKFILRIEDTDTSRYIPKAEDYIKETFKWLNIEFSEGPDQGGEYGPYRQSERKEVYQHYVDDLLKEGKAYIAFDTPEELEIARKEIPNFQYDASTRMKMKNSLTLSKEEIDELMQRDDYVVRIKIEPGIVISVDDIIRGEVQVNSSVLDDKVIYKKKDSLPTYHLANIVDDHLMKITHVIRGEEWIPSAPLHVWLYKSFGWEETMPKFAHLPLILKPDGNGKLSKRDGDRLGFPVFPLQSVDEKTGAITMGYREMGFLPDAVINFLALLGWNPGSDKEIFTREELIDQFDLSHCSKSGAKFDYEKAKWFNHQYIQMMSNEELAKIFLPKLKEKGIEVDPIELEKIVGLIKERLYLLTDFWEQAGFFFLAPSAYDEKAVKKFWNSEASERMTELIGLLSSIDNFSSEEQETKVKEWIAEKSYPMGKVLNAFRLSLVGASKGPHLFDISSFIGKEESLRRLQKAIDTLSV